MDFGFGEERGKLPFSYSSSSSSPSSSSQYKTANLMPLGNNESWESRLYDTYQQQPRVFELMSGNDEEVMKRCGDSDGHGSRGSFCMEKEHMFDKVVTPSDVGKLNRLVIPKQHAEKYFPLDSSTNEKGLLLNFEDLNGKPWRFRYSYWNSSQSYVMTKGWSRFVKEKKLDAGDIVSFQRGVGEAGKDHLYIDWRRRPDAPEPAATLGGNIALFPHQFAFHHHHQHSVPWSPLLLRSMPAATSLSMPRARDHLHLSHLNNNVVHRGGAAVYGSVMNQNPQPNCSNGSIVYFRPAPAGPQAQPLAAAQVQQGVGVERMVFDSVPVVHGKAGAKRLRLFGVNMDCPIPESDGNRDSAGSHPLPLLSSSNSQSPLQLRLFNSTAIPPSFLSNEKPTSMSLDFDL